MKRPMFCGAIIASICVFISYYNIRTTLLCGVGLICFIVAFAVNKVKAKNYFAVGVAFLVLISLIFSYKNLEKIDKYSGERIVETFVVTEVEEGEKYNSITALCKSGTVLPKNIKLRISCFDKTEKFIMGNCVTASVNIKSLKNSDNKAYYYSSGIYATGKLGNVLERHSDNIFYKRAGKIKNYVKSTISRNMQKDNAATLLGITIGDKNLFTDEFNNNVKLTGVSHVMVVSGMHLTIILGAVFWLLDKIFYHAYIRLLISFSAIVMITSICGFTHSVIRAGIMFLLLSLAPVVNRDNDSLNSLGTAIIAILLYCPFAVLNVGFQLSALATFGIIYFVPFFDKRLKIQNKLLKGLVLSFIVTLSATVMTTPVCIYHFGYISLISPITNLLISFAVTVALCLGIIGLFLNLVPLIYVLTDIIFKCAEITTMYINFVINYLAKFPFAAVRAGDLLLIASIFISIGSVLFIYTCKYRENLLKLNYK